MAIVCLTWSLPVTELEALRAEVQQLRAENKAMQQFVYVASHDLQAPVRTVRGFLQLLERRYSESLGGDAQEFISMAMASSGQMQSLVAKLLQWSRLHTRAGSPAPVNLISVFQSQVQADTLTDRLGREFHTSIEGHPEAVMMDPGHATQFIQHLLDNSRDYVSPEREPTLTLTCAKCDDGRLRFVLEDNGRGIAQEHLEKVSEPFFRGAAVEGESSGSGLGLALCQRIMDVYGGELLVHSDGESGTAVEWVLEAQGKQ